MSASSSNKAMRATSAWVGEWLVNMVSKVWEVKVWIYHSFDCNVEVKVGMDFIILYRGTLWIQGYQYIRPH